MISAISGSANQPLTESSAVTPVEKVKPVRRDQGQGFSPEQVRQLQILKARDREVRAHEQAHQSAGGGLTGGIRLTFQTGPDGQPYAVGGEVSIDTSTSDDPSATVAKMQQVIAAALAPGNPSAQDRAVAAHAQSLMAEAQAVLTRQQSNTLKDPAQSSGNAERNTADPVRQAYSQPDVEPGGLLSLMV